MTGVVAYRVECLEGDTWVSLDWCNGEPCSELIRNVAENKQRRLIQAVELKHLSIDDIISIADKTSSAEPGTNGYILPVTFARAILEAATGVKHEQ